MKKIHALISGSGSLYGVAIIQALLKSELPLKVVACDVSARTLGLYLAHRAYIVPPASQEELYLAKVLTIIKQEKIHAIFIASSHELEFYSRHKQYLEEKTGARVFTNYPEILQICSDKWLTIDFLKNQGFAFPLTIRYPEDRDQLDEFISKVGFPIVLKPRRGAGSQGLYIVRQRTELYPLLEKQTAIILQQYLPDDDGEFTTGICVGSNGKVLSGITLKRYLQDGMTMSADCEGFNTVTAYCQQVAKVLKPYGPCNFQSRILKGQPYIFEINPRFSSSTGMRCLLGVNEAEILLRGELLGETVSHEIVKGSVIRQYTDYFVPTEAITKLEQETGK